MSDARDPRRPTQPPHASSASLRADLIATSIFQHAAVELMLGNHGERAVAWADVTYAELSEYSYVAAAAHVAESQRRDPNTGELLHPVDGLPKDET